MNTALLLRRAMMGASGNEGTIKYGYLYNWYVTQGTGNASITSSDGWRLPTVQELLALFPASGTDIGAQCKDSGSTYWLSPNSSAINLYNMKFMPSGTRTSAGIFSNINTNFRLFSTYPTDGYYMTIYNSSTFTSYSGASKKEGYSYRLFRPTTPQDPPNDGDYCLPYIGNDGTSYLTVRIGTQVWMAENLAETKYRGGTDITNVTDNTAWAALTSGARCAYGNNEANVFMTPVVNTSTFTTSIKYGYLYNWYVTQGTGNASIIPSDMEALGWKVPNAVYNDPNNVYSAKVLQSYTNGGNFTGSDLTAYIKLRETGTQYWTTDTVPTTNELKFGMRGSSYRAYHGGFAGSFKTEGFFWTTTNSYTSESYCTVFSQANSTLNFNYSFLHETGVSIRLVRPATTGTNSEADLLDGTWCEDYIGNDGRAYKTVKIGTQVWTTENLAETKYRDGSSIPNVTDNTAWAALATGARCAYQNIEENAIETKFYSNLVQKNIIYGFLYNWYTTQGTGSNSVTSTDMWVVPSTTNWDILRDYNDGNSSITSGRLKEVGVEHWLNPNTNATDLYSFDALPGGFRNTVGGFTNMTFSGLWWSSSFGGVNAWYRRMTYDDSVLFEDYNPFVYGYSIRLVRNATLQERGYPDSTYCPPYIGNDGQSYKTVKIGTQVWLAENLIETKYRNGLNIVDTVDSTQWAALAQSSYCAYNNVITNVDTTKSLTTPSVLWYKFNGDTVDSSVALNNGVINGSPTLAIDRYGRSSSYQFSTLSDYITPTTDNVLFTGGTKFSISFWVYVTAFTGGFATCMALKTAANSGEPLLIGISNNTSFNGVWCLGAIGPKTKSDTNGDLFVGRWSHVVITHNNNNGYGLETNYYINSSKCSAPSTAGSLISMTNTTMIGRMPYAGLQLNGRLDDIRIFNTELTANEVTTIFLEHDNV